MMIKSDFHSFAAIMICSVGSPLRTVTVSANFAGTMR
jgi:hypothetical protein